MQIVCHPVDNASPRWIMQRTDDICRQQSADRVFVSLPSQGQSSEQLLIVQWNSTLVESRKEFYAYWVLCELSKVLEPGLSGVESGPGKTFPCKQLFVDSPHYNDNGSLTATHNIKWREKEKPDNWIVGIKVHGKVKIIEWTLFSVFSSRPHLRNPADLS